MKESENGIKLDCVSLEAVIGKKVTGRRRCRQCLQKHRYIYYEKFMFFFFF